MGKDSDRIVQGTLSPSTMFTIFASAVMGFATVTFIHWRYLAMLPPGSGQGFCGGFGGLGF